jgi:tRNA (mo5U34)-methyltransferase
MNEDLVSLFEGHYWHQKWEIAPGIFTPGHNPVAELMTMANVPADLRGKRVLDVGAWNGCFSFECERRGAEDVLAIGPETSSATGFDKLKRFLNSRVEYKQGTVYHLQPEEIGKFDIIIFFGVLYHLRHPLLALDMMRRVCLGNLFLETAALDANTIIDSEGMLLSEIAPRLVSVPILQFYRSGELNNDTTNWFSFNKKCIEDMLLSSGFKPIHAQSFGHRLAVSASVVLGSPEWFNNSGEGVYYDVVTRPLLGRPDVYD